MENADLTKNLDIRLYEGVWRPGNEDRISPYRAPRYRDPESGQWVTPETHPSSRFVQKRNELKISSLQLSYDFFRHDFVKKIGLERILLRFNANDLFTFSSIDIERGTSYPFARTFNFSLNVTL